MLRFPSLISNLKGMDVSMSFIVPSSDRRIVSVDINTIIYKF
jgi:hypothetical protein